MSPRTSRERRPAGRWPRRPSRARGGRSVNWRQTIRGRVAVAAGAFLLWTVAVETRLIYLQIIQHDELVARADGQQLRTIPIHPKRGEILDRNGAVLAYSVDADTVYAVPTEIDDPAATAAALCEALDDCDDVERRGLEARLRRGNAFVYVQRQVSLAEARRVAALHLEGVGFLTENRRFYPNRELAAHVLGYVGIDNQGLGGVESTYDRDISGSPGHVLIQTDARRRAFSRVERPPTAGATLELTIDKHLQHIVERELSAGIDAYEADAGAVVVLDPYTGEILALASYPTFNPHAFGDASSGQRRNRAIQDIYEPGSTFKVVTASAAFEEGVVSPDEIFDVSAGAIVVGGDRIPDFRTYGRLSFTDVLVKSSNVGAIRVGLRLGPERLSRYVRRFGFGQALSPDFPSENPGIVWPPLALNDRALASIAMGYQVAVTPLQMAAAVAAIANGGELVEPRVVRALTRDRVRETPPRRVVRRAVTTETAARLTAIMEAVVARGTGRRAQVPGYAVAGKTGTAEKLIDGRYSHRDHNASFVGFVPARSPRFVILVMVDTPRTAMVNGIRQRLYTGGAVAAPIFQRIAEGALRHFAVPTDRPAARVAEARRAAAPAARWQPVSTRPPDAAGDRVPPAADAMPDLHGLSARTAAAIAGRLGLQLEIVGRGAVAHQRPAPGVEVAPGGAAAVWLDRYAPGREAGER